MRHVAILGGGTAGMSAAVSLAKLGIHCTIVERSDRLGGKAADLTCKGIRECVRCDVCMSTERVSEVFGSDLIRVIACTEPCTVERDMGRYRIGLVPCRSVDQRRCDGCGRCAEECPSRAISAVPSLRKRFRIDTSACPFPAEECTACIDACPQDAIRTGDGPEDLWVDAVIVAIGHEVFDAAVDSRLGYGSVPGVVTARELEAELNRNGNVLALTAGKRPGSIAFVQCVGSRGRPGAEYCSKVCCKYAMKLGQMLRAIDKGTEVTYYIMDWRRYAAEDSLTELARADAKVHLVRGRPAEITAAGSGRPAVRCSSADSDQLGETEYDLVVLSVGEMPPHSISDMAESFGTRTSPMGFLFTEGRQAQAMESKGVFSCGSCTGPKDIEECVMDGEIAAMKASAYLEERE